MIKSILRVSLTLAIILTSVAVLATTEGDLSHISWDSSTPITWDLFQGTPPADATQRTEAAAIHMTVRWHASYSISSTDGAMWFGQVATITVSNSMEPSESWVVPGKAYANVLSHEQSHFDLNEAYRRKLECVLQGTSSCSDSTHQGAVNLLNSSLHQAANAILQKLSEMQSLYDSQTSHGTNTAEQNRWSNLISNWLEAPTTAP